MRRRHVRSLLFAATAFGAAAALQSPLLAQTASWVGPFTVGNNPWSNPASWSTGTTPPGSPSTALEFSNFDSNTYTATNDLGDPFVVNSLALDNWSTVSFAVSSFIGSQIELAGASPTINADGPNSESVGAFNASNTGVYGLSVVGNATVNDNGQGTLTLGSAGLTSTGSLTIAGTGLGQISLASLSSGVSNVIPGGVILDGGILNLTTAGSLGNSPQLTINGGLLKAGSGSSPVTISTPLVLNSNLVFFGGSGANLTGPITGTSDGDGIELTNYLQASSSSNALTVSGAASYRGATTVDPAPLRAIGATFTVAATGSLPNTSGISTGQGGTLAVSATAGNSGLPATVPITLNNAFLSITPDNAASVSTTTGNLTTSGLATFTFGSLAAASGITNTFNFGTTTLNDNGTLFFRGNWTGTTATGVVTGQALFTGGLATIADASLPAGAKSVVPFAAGSITATATTPTAFVSYNSTSGVVLIPVTDATQVTQFGSLTGGFASSALTTNDVYLNFNTSGTTTMNNSSQVYALSASSLTTLNGSGNTLTVVSGTILASASLTLNGPTLAFGSATGFIHVATGSTTFTMHGGSITGSGGLVISGINTQATAATPSAAQFSDAGTYTDSSNPFTGGLYVNGTTLQYTDDAQLGTTTGPMTLTNGGITLNGGLLIYNNPTNSNTTLARPIRLGSGGGGILETPGYNVAAGTITVSSTVSGPGAFELSTGVGATNAGVTALTGSNTYSGGTFIYTGTLNVSSDANLGAAATPIYLGGGTLQFGSSATFNRTVDITTSPATIDTLGNSPVLAGAISTYTGTGVATLYKVGSGTLNLTADNSQLSSLVNISGGTLSLSGNGALPQIQNTNISSGATLQFNNSAGSIADRYPNLGRVTLLGGTVDLFGGGTETIGSVLLSPAAGITSSTVSAEPAGAVLTSTGVISGGSAYAPTNPTGTNPPAFTPTTLTASAQMLVKAGAGTFVLPTADTFAGGTNLSAGTLTVSGPKSLGFGAPIYAALSTETTVGSTSVAAAAALDLAGQSLTEPITLNGGTLTNSSPTAATLTSGVKGATLSATSASTNYSGVTAGQVAGYSGAGYDITDKIAVTGNGTGATAVPVFGLSPNAIVDTSNGGSYTGGTVTVSVTGGGGSGAAFNAYINGGLLHIVMTNPGSGFTSTPTLNVTDNSLGSGAADTLSLNPDPFTIVGVEETNAGTGYTTPPTFTIVNSSGGVSNGSGASIGSGIISSLTLASSSSVGGAGPISINSAISGGNAGLTKVGPDTVTLNGAGTFSGGTTIAAGTLAVANPLAIGVGNVILSGGTLGLFSPETLGNAVASTTGNSGISVAVTASSTTANIGSLTIGAGTTVSLTATGTVSAPRTVLAPTSLTINGNGTLDIGSNDLDIAGTGLSTITTDVATGFAGGTWAGTGITCSAAAANPGHLTAVGVISNIENSTVLYGTAGRLGLFDKSSPGAADILVKYTYYGDANLDGKVDGSDYTLIDAGFDADLAHPGSITGWYNGDFNYDGKIDGSDYTLIDNAFNTEGSPLVAGTSNVVAGETAQLAAAVVPEPAGLMLTAMGAGAILRRRKQNKN